VRRRIAAIWPAAGPAVGLTGVSALLALGMVAHTAAAVTTQDVSFRGKYDKRDRHKVRAGLSLRTTFSITDPAAPAPLQLDRTTLRFPKGSVVNGRYFPKCKLAAIQAKGPKGCPRGSKIGGGTARGAAPPIVASVAAKVSLFNGVPVGRNPTLIIYSLPDLGPVLVMSGVLKSDRSGRYGYVLDVKVPPIKTLPSAPDASVTFFDATVNNLSVKRGKRKINYIDAPVLCNGTYFLLDGAFSYRGGVVNPVLEKFTLNGGPRCP
jgi:hypothetical protein